MEKLVRDDKNQGALLNKDKNALMAYKQKKKQAERLNSLENSVEEISKTLDEIKQLLVNR